MGKADRSSIIAALKNPGSAAAKKPKEKKGDSKYTAEEKARMDAEGKGLSGSAKGWDEKFKVMNTSDFWLCFCFRSEDDVADFVARLGITLDEDRMVPGAELAAALGVDPDTPVAELPKRRLRRRLVSKEEVAWSAKYQAHPKPDPGPDTGDLAADMTRDLLDWLAWAEDNGQDKRWLAEHGTTIDYPHWFVAWFLTDEQKAAFLRLTNLIDVGDKYLDGYQVIDILDEPS
ncbi:hypothetical protein GCM10009624_27850 [Gordonia sinesedis]